LSQTGVACGDANVAIAGSFEGTLDFGGGALSNAGGFDAFVALLKL